MISERVIVMCRAALFASLLLLPGVCRAAFVQTNLVSSVSGLAPVTDANLKNPWGISFGPTGPFWVSNQVTGTATVYNGSGQPQPQPTPLVVTIPSLAGGGPTGQVFNGTSDFDLEFNSSPATFLFANLDGRILGWNPGVNPTQALIEVDNSDVASYTGLALANNGSGNFLYAANTLGNKIDIFDGSFSPTTLAGSFTDPNLPAGFTAYNIQLIGGMLIVTFENETSGGGIVDAFDLNGNLIRRISANGSGGPLDSPWGLALAPAGFGSFGGALLVGNEGDGRISAFNLTTGDFLGQLTDQNNTPIANPGLWGLIFGNGGNGGDPNTLYFAAGIEDETEGLFGSISASGSGSVPSPVPEPSSFVICWAGVLALVVKQRRKNRRPGRM